MIDVELLLAPAACQGLCVPKRFLKFLSKSIEVHKSSDLGQEKYNMLAQDSFIILVLNHQLIDAPAFPPDSLLFVISWA